MQRSTKIIILRSKERLDRYTSAAVLEKKGKAVALGNIVQTIHALTDLRTREVKEQMGDKRVDRLKVKSRAVKEVKRTGEKGEVMNNKSGARRSRLVRGYKPETEVEIEKGKVEC